MKINSRIKNILNGIIERGLNLGYNLEKIYIDNNSNNLNLKQIAKKYLKKENLTTVEKNFFNDVKSFHHSLEKVIKERIKKANDE